MEWTNEQIGLAVKWHLENNGYIDISDDFNEFNYFMMEWYLSSPD